MKFEEVRIYPAQGYPNKYSVMVVINNHSFSSIGIFSLEDITADFGLENPQQYVVPGFEYKWKQKF